MDNKQPINPTFSASEKFYLYSLYINELDSTRYTAAQESFRERMSIMNLWQRAICADKWRRTRLHDMKGHRASVRVMLTDLPRAALWAVVREMFDWRLALPWVPYNVIRAL